MKRAKGNFATLQVKQLQNGRMIQKKKQNIKRVIVGAAAAIVTIIISNSN